MPRYHINPTTGNPGPCRAMVSCPFGDMESEHFDSAAQARRAYEQGSGGAFAALRRKGPGTVLQLTSGKPGEETVSYFRTVAGLRRRLVQQMTLEPAGFGFGYDAQPVLDQLFKTNSPRRISQIIARTPFLFKDSPQVKILQSQAAVGKDIYLFQDQGATHLLDFDGVKELAKAILSREETGKLAIPEIEAANEGDTGLIEHTLFSYAWRSFYIGKLKLED